MLGDDWTDVYVGVALVGDGSGLGLLEGARGLKTVSRQPWPVRSTHIDAQLLYANVRHLYTTAALDPGVHPLAGREGERGESGPQDADAGERRATVHHQVLKIRPDVLMYPPDRVKSGAPRMNQP